MNKYLLSANTCLRTKDVMVCSNSELIHGSFTYISFHYSALPFKMFNVMDDARMILTLILELGLWSQLQVASDFPYCFRRNSSIMSQEFRFQRCLEKEGRRMKTSYFWVNAPVIWHHLYGTMKYSSIPGIILVIINVCLEIRVYQAL